jgi:energy-coupling factor transport system substrate-specific component
MAVTEKQERSQAKIWSVGVRQIVYMALGAALYGGLSYLTNILQLPSTSNVSFRPGIVIPLFFGAVFGPWVGLFVGGIGNLIGDYTSGYGVYWNWDVGNGLIGFVAGLSMYLTWGRYNNFRNIAIAEIFGVVGVVVGIAFAAYSDMPLLKYTTAAATGNFIPATVADLVNGIILLPILLVAYNAAVRRTGRG